MNLEKKIEQKEQPPFRADLRVDFIRHGQPKYTKEEMKSANFEGELTKEGVEQIKKQIEELIKGINKQKEVVVIWTSPKNRAKQSSEVIRQMLSEKGIDRIVDKASGANVKASLSDVKISKDFMEEAIKDNIDFKNWMVYWSEMDNLPEGTESAEDVKKRVQRVVTYLERIARNVQLGEEKRLHFICVGHEELVRDLLEESFGMGTKEGEGPGYAEVVRMDITKSDKNKNAILDLSYRNKKSKLSFDKSTREFKGEK